MNRSHRYGKIWFSIAVVAAWCASAGYPASAKAAAGASQPKSASCSENDSGLKLPPGFCATIFADGIGHARHLVVAPNGVVYVNTWSGRYYGNDTPHAGGFLVALEDTTGAGKANVIRRFGMTAPEGGKGGTGIGLYKGSLYAEINDKIVRYKLDIRLDRAARPRGADRHGTASYRRSSHASLHDHGRWLALYRRCHPDQCLSGEESHSEIAGDRAVYGARDPRGYLAL